MEYALTRLVSDTKAHFSLLKAVKQKSMSGQMTDN